MYRDTSIAALCLSKLNGPVISILENACMVRRLWNCALEFDTDRHISYTFRWALLLALFLHLPLLRFVLAAGLTITVFTLAEFSLLIDFSSSSSRRNLQKHTCLSITGTTVWTIKSSSVSKETLVYQHQQHWCNLMQT